jgi:putative ABC transport system permease protein
MRLHVELRERQLREAGLSEREARIAAQRRFGNLLRLREDSHEAWGWTWLEQSIRDARYGARSLARTPLFTGMAITIVALGIATNTFIFSIAYSVLFRPLPFEAPDELVRVYEVSPKGEPTGVAPATFVDFRREARSFAGIATLTLDGFNLTGTPEAEVVRGAWVSPELFSILRVRPVLGRAFLSGEQSSGRDAIISHSLWTRRFGRDPTVLGKTLTLSSHDRPDEAETYAIVGVLPADFWFLRNQFELWLPLSEAPDASAREPRNRPVVARLKPDVTVAQATAELRVLVRRVAERHPTTNAHWSANVAPLHGQLVQNIRPALLTLLSAAGFVILIACANLANVLLVRGLVRERQFAISMALGAGRAPLIRQGVIEALILSVCGCVVGLALTRWSLRLVVGFIPDRIQQGLPGGLTSITIDGVVVLVAVALALATGVIFGLIPALQVTSIPVIETLQANNRGVVGDARSRRVRNGLLISEIALAVVLLAGAGMLMQTFVRLQEVPLGFTADRVLALRLALPRTEYGTPERQVGFFTEALTRMRAVPGVEAAGVVTAPPLWPAGESTFVIGQTDRISGSGVAGREVIVSPAYFETLAVPVLKGRSFTERDTVASPHVAIISAAMAARYWPNGDPIGQRIRREDRRTATAAWSTVVGVVGDVRYALEEPPGAVVYRPYAQQSSPIVTVLVRTAGPPANTRAAALNALWGVDRDQPTYDIGTLEESIASALAQPRFSFLLMAVFAALAVTLACLGVYELVSYSVTIRTHELAVRMSLGASPGDILWLVLGSSLKVICIGLSIGIAGAAALGTLLVSHVFGLSRPEPQVIAATAILFCAVALLASYIPARAVNWINPLDALRSE